jgi:hypothetical protein
MACRLHDEAMVSFVAMLAKVQTFDLLGFGDSDADGVLQYQPCDPGGQQNIDTNHANAYQLSN